MTSSASLVSAPGKSLFARLARLVGVCVGVAALALSPQMAFAQHSSGGHGGGGGGAGGQSSGGGGGHFSPPPAPAPRPPSAPTMSPPRPVNVPPSAPPIVYVPPRVPPPASSPVVHPVPVTSAPVGFRDPRFANSVTNPAAGQLEQHMGIGFAAAQASQSVQSSSTPPAPATGRPGLLRRIFGDGRQIWTEPAHIGPPPATRSGSTTMPARVFRGPAGLGPSAGVPVAPPHIVNFPPHRFRGPIIVEPGFGSFGYGSPFGFGYPFFFRDPFLGFQFGSVWVPCNGTGAGFLCAPFNFDYGYEAPYNSVMSVGTDTGTQDQQIYSPYSPALPPAEENTKGSSPDEYLLYLNDGSVYLVGDYWFADGKLVYVTSSGQESVDLSRIDMQKTLDVNAKRGLVFTLRTAPQTSPPTPQSDQNVPTQPNQQTAPVEPAPAPVPTPQQ